MASVGRSALGEGDELGVAFEHAGVVVPEVGRAQEETVVGAQQIEHAIIAGLRRDELVQFPGHCRRQGRGGKVCAGESGEELRRRQRGRREVAEHDRGQRAPPGGWHRQRGYQGRQTRRDRPGENTGQWPRLTPAGGFSGDRFGIQFRKPAPPRWSSCTRCPGTPSGGC